MVLISVAMASQATVVGGGLAGLSAGHSVVLVDMSFCCGVNSTMASNGINGDNTGIPPEKGIGDSAEMFTSDTRKGGAKKLALAKVLCENSGADVEWLSGKFNLDLSLVARLGDHSTPRTHRGKERFPGMTTAFATCKRNDTECLDTCTCSRP